jgi:hypothetical protein
MGDLIDAGHRFQPQDAVAPRIIDLDWRMEYDKLWKRYVALEDENAHLAAAVALLEDEVAALEAELGGPDRA